MTPTEIPAEVKERIEAEAEKYANSHLIADKKEAFMLGQAFMYCDLMNNAPYIFGPERTKKPQPPQQKK